MAEKKRITRKIDMKALAKAMQMVERDKETKLTDEELSVIRAYRGLARWERNALRLIMQSMVAGGLTDQTDKFSWPEMNRMLDEVRVAHHG